MFRTTLLSPSIFLFILFSFAIQSQAQSNDIFTKYDWLEDLVDPADCDGEKILEYNLGAFAFVLVSGDSDEYLYFETGQLFCTGSNSFSCIQAYGFSDSQIGLEFECMNGSNNVQSACDAVALADELYDEFPWLDGLVELYNCTDESVIVFQQDVHKYLAVRSPMGTQFYYQDGSLLCSNSSSFDCATAYGFTDADIISQFLCGQSGSFCIDGIAVSGVYTIDFLDFPSCSFFAEQTIDLIGLNTNCYMDNGVERCLNGEIKFEMDGSYSFGFTISGPGPNGGLQVSGGQGSGIMIEDNGTFLNCNPSGNGCYPANIEVSQNRVSFEVLIEDCFVRVGGYQ